MGLDMYAEVSEARKKDGVKITKEEFLENTTEEEVFSIIHEALVRFKEFKEIETNEEERILMTDGEIGMIAEEMIKEIKKSNYL